MTQTTFVMTVTLLLCLMILSPVVTATMSFTGDDGSMAYIHFQSIPQSTYSTNDSVAYITDHSNVLGSSGASDEGGLMNAVIDQLWLFTTLSPSEIAFELRGSVGFVGLIALFIVGLAFFIGAPYVLLNKIFVESNTLEAQEIIALMLLTLFSFIIGVVAIVMIGTAF